MNAVIERLQDLTVRDVMAQSVIRVATGQPMTEVAATLQKHGLSTAPVVDDQGICVGVISATDFLRRDAAVVTHAGTTASAPTHTHGAHQGPSVWSPADVAGSYMTCGVQSVATEAPLLHAAKIICAQHVHRLPVVDRTGKPIGMISTIDIVSALLKAIDEQGLG